MQKLPYYIVIGDNEMKTKKMVVESRNGEKGKEAGIDAIAEKLKNEIVEKK